MAIKPYSHNRLSGKLCIVCRKKIKRNVLARKPDTNTCYSCYRTAQKKHTLNRKEKEHEKYSA